MSVDVRLCRLVRGVVHLQCWFCHTWAEVPRRMRNAWQCLACTQYNGFDKVRYAEALSLWMIGLATH